MKHNLITGIETAFAMISYFIIYQWYQNTTIRTLCKKPRSENIAVCDSKS